MSEEEDDADDADDKPTDKAADKPDDKPDDQPDDNKAKPTDKVVAKTAAVQTLTPADKAVVKAMANRAKWKLFWIVSVISLVADQVTKLWARSSLDTYGPKDHVCVIPDDISSQVCGGVAHKVVGSFWHWRTGTPSIGR